MSIVTMLSRMFMQRMLRWGMRRGTAALTRSGTRKAGMGKAGTSKTGSAKAATGRATQADSAQSKASRLAVKRARQAARVTRKLGR